jgi:prepilin-type N-terminal cleavage/methylation domain-containing protein
VTPEFDMRRAERGFTLTELAIVVFIIALLGGGLLMTLAAQNENRELAETRRVLDVARDALIGFAVANGRLPCPATAASNGREDPIGGGACTITLDGGAGAAIQPGFLPAITLSIGPTNGAGQLIDAWGNPVRYAVTRVTAPAGIVNAFTTAGGLKAQGYAGLTTDLRVCVNLPGPGDATCGANRVQTFVAALVFSPGRTHSASGPLGPDEQENMNIGVAPARNPVFVTHASSADFDDILVTLSPNVLYGRLVSAGAL